MDYTSRYTFWKYLGIDDVLELDHGATLDRNGDLL
jgi:hypothetical protein